MIIKVLKIKPDQHPEVVEIDDELSSLQTAVDGYIECVYPWDADVGIICNDEGKLLGLQLNRALYDENGKMTDIIAGDFLVVGLTDIGFCSLTDEQIAHYSKLFYHKQIFTRLGSDAIIAIPVPDEDSEVEG